MLTRRDPYVNLLRGTVAGFAAGVGGADAVTVPPFDAAIGGVAAVLPADRPQHPDAAGRRVAPGPGDRPGRRLLVRRGAHRGAGPRGLGVLPGDRGRRRRARRAGLRAARRAHRRHAGADGNATWPPAGPRSPASASSPTCTNKRSTPSLPVPTNAPDGRLGCRSSGRPSRSRRSATAPTPPSPRPGRRPRAFLATLGPLAAYTARAGLRPHPAAGRRDRDRRGRPDRAPPRRWRRRSPRRTRRSPCSAPPTRSTPSGARTSVAALRDGRRRACCWPVGRQVAAGVDGHLSAGCDALAVIERSTRALEAAR